MFATEKELVSTIASSTNHFVGAIANWNQCPASQPEVMMELNLGHGIPDLVVAKFQTENRIGSRAKQLKYEDLLVYTIIKKFVNGVDIIALQDQTRISSNRLKLILSNLLSEEFIKHSEKMFFIGAHKFQEDLEVIAIEAKLKNWKRALKQAYRYKWFATYSYVFLDANYVTPALKNKSLFKAYNIGLACVHKDGNVEIKVKPQRIKPYDDAMLFLVGEYLLFGAKE